MAFTLEGLASVAEEVAKRPASGGSFEDRPKPRYIKMDEDQSIKLVFLQEIDRGSPNFSEKNGLAVFAVMHSNPDNWQKSAACTADEGNCYGCDNNWRQKIVLYVNVLVDDGKEAPYVALWNRGLGKGSVAQDLLNMAADDEFDLSITDKTFKFTKTGKKKETTYSLTPLPKPHTLKVESYELFNLKDYIFTVSYDRQEAYYTDGQGAPEAVASKPAYATSSSSGTDNEW